MQHPKSEESREGNRKCTCGHARKVHWNGNGVCHNLACTCEAFTRPASAAGSRGCGCDDAAGTSCARHAGEGAPDAPVEAADAKVELMADWYTRSPSGLAWCLVHGTSFKAFCAGCASETSVSTARGAARRFDSSLGEESNLRASVLNPAVIEGASGSIMPTGQSRSLSPIDPVDLDGAAAWLDELCRTVASLRVRLPLERARDLIRQAAEEVRRG